MQHNLEIVLDAYRCQHGEEYDINVVLHDTPTEYDNWLAAFNATCFGKEYSVRCYKFQAIIPKRIAPTNEIVSILIAGSILDQVVICLDNISKESRLLLPLFSDEGWTLL